MTSWLRREDGQDLVEYSLLLAFVVVVSAALFLYNSDAVAAIWTITNNNLSSASSMATSN
jgi:Flp pilus assembly pilin Flp